MSKSEQSYSRQRLTVEMVDPQGTILAEIDDPAETRDSVAITYGCMIAQRETDRVAEVNRAIIERWSMSALRYIKTEAWAWAEGRRT